MSNYGMVSSGYLKVNPNGSIEITDKYIKYTDRVGRTFSSLSHHGACRSALRGSIQIII